MAIAQTLTGVNADRDTLESVFGELCRHVPARQAPLYAAKDALDRAVGLVLLILALPLIGLLVAFIRWSSPGPGIYAQKRVGKRGRIFTMYKLRSMRCDAEAGTGPVWAGAAADPRVTPLGYWLRVLHLDELPQLYNVARGEMSLVGPRPERPEFVSVLARKIPGYVDRLEVLPGITGLAQINLPADTDLHSVRCKLVLDQQYIRSAGVVMDVRIILCTLLRLFGLRGGRAVSLLGLTRVVDIPTETDAREPVGPPTPQTIGQAGAEAAFSRVSLDQSQRAAESQPAPVIASASRP
jgi:lipopolysaccharide/colanic/teichoic acid biosynthesis glycosyltransferase